MHNFDILKEIMEETDFIRTAFKMHTLDMLP